MTGVDLEKALDRLKAREERKSPDEVLAAFKQILADDDQQEEEILGRIFSHEGLSPQLDLRKLDPQKIYTLDQVKELCTQYRLRFLDSAYFKGEIPYEATRKVKALQKDQNQTLSAFKIMAPAPMFHLEYKDKDPLLFVPLGENRFYLIHKWGRDLHPLRKLMVFPFRHFKALMGSLAGLCAFIVSVIPSSLLIGPYDNHSLSIRVIFFFYLFIALGGMTLLYGFSRVKNFNSVLWNSRYDD